MTLITNTAIIPMTERGLFLRGDILISDDGKIAAIGDVKAKADNVIDGSSMIALPSFVNAHTHAAMTLMRNFKDDKPNLQEWLAEIFRIEDKLVDNDIYWASLLGIAEMIKSGCTAFADMYFYSWNTVRAVKESGTRAAISLTLFGDGNETRKRFRELVPRVQEEARGYDGIRIDIAPHAIYTCTAETYQLAAEWAISSNAYLHTHLSETKKEVDDAVAAYGKTPLEYLDSLGVFKAKTYLAHAVHLTDSEIERLSEIKDASVVHNPASNLKLQSGIAPIQKFLSKGINTALGTDGASSNNNLSMIKDICLAALLSHIPAYDILEMATINGAKALGLDDRIGTIEVGKDADITLINTEDVNTAPVNDPFSAVVFSSDRGNIDTVFSKGRKLLERGRLLTIDEEEVIRKAQECWDNLLRR